MRDEFTKQTLDVLAKRVGVRCSNPACRKLTSGPREESIQIVNIGVGAHISAASPGGPRYDPSLTSEERRSPDNGIWLCQSCAKLVDNDLIRYTSSVLTTWKERAEKAALSEIEGDLPGTGNLRESVVELETNYKCLRRDSDRHDYELEIKVSNLGNEPIYAFHVDLEFPSRVIFKPENIPFYVTSRSNRDICFFRISHRRDEKEIYPGDSEVIMLLPYHMDVDIFQNCKNLFQQSIRATFYQSGHRPLTVRRSFKTLQMF